MKKPPPYGVTDHALVRYLERVMGVDVASIRRGIARRAANGIEQQAIGVKRHGTRFVLRGGVVVTVHRIKRKKGAPRG